MQELAFPRIAGGTENGAATLENSLAVFEGAKCVTSI